MKLATVKELSRFLKVKEKTIYQWANLGVIPSMKIGRLLRFDIDEVELYLEGCKRPPESGYNPVTQARGPRKGGV